MQRVVRSTLVGLLTIAGLTACGDKVTVPVAPTAVVDTTIHGVTVSPSNVTLSVGGTATLAAAVDAGPGQTVRTVAWSSSDATVASVGAATGVVTALKAGTATIIAAATANAQVRGAAVVTVQAANTGAPTVTISTINSTVCGIGGCNSVPINTSNASGQLDVTLNVEPNGQTLKTVSATMTCPGPTTMTKTQTISGAVQADLAAEAAAAPVTLSFNTADFTLNAAGTVATVALRNGQCTLSATATTASGGNSATNPTQQITLNNTDGVLLTNAFAAVANAEGVTPTTTTALDAGGLPWRAGAVTVSAVPVLYSGRTIAQVSITLPGAAGATQTVTAAPFSATWSATSTNGSNVTRQTLVGAGFEVNGTTPTGITPTIVAVDANGNDLALGPLNAGIVNQTTFRLDNTPPQSPTTFVTPGRQFGWVNASYVFTGTGGASFGATGTTKYVACGDGNQLASPAPGGCNPQLGVSANGVSGTTGLNGQTTFTYYAIPNASFVASSATNGTGNTATACSTTGWTKLTSGTAGDLADSPNNTAYVVRVFETDKLGNARCTDLSNAANIINSGAYVKGTIGVDKVAPTMVQLDPGNAACPTGGCVSNLQKVNISFLAGNGGVVPSFQVSYSDFPAQSGFSTTPVTTMLTRLAIDPATSAASTTGTAFGCPIGFNSNNTPTCGLSNNIQAGGTVAADAGSSAGTSSGVDGYYAYTGQIIDLARNTGNTVTRQVVVDRAAPVMGGIAVPATVTGGQTASFATSATDNLDLVSADYTLNYVTTPAGAAAQLNIRSLTQPIGSSVAFDNVLQTSLSFNLVVPFFIRAVSTTTAGGAPQNNAVAATGIAVRAYDGADNPSTAGASVINAANLPQTTPTNFAAAQANGAVFTGTGFSVSNAAANVSNCPAAGCAGGAAAANATTVTFSATAQGTESAAAPAFQFANPFTSVQFYYLDTGYAGASNEWILIGAVPAPSVTDNAAQTIRTFTWTMTTAFDPPAVLGFGTTLKVIAVGVNALGDALSSAQNAAITLTNP
jgi:hypothetical protein